MRYAGYVGQEFIPTRDPLAGLRAGGAGCATCNPSGPRRVAKRGSPPRVRHGERPVRARRFDRVRPPRPATSPSTRSAARRPGRGRSGPPAPSGRGSRSRRRSAWTCVRRPAASSRTTAPRAGAPNRVSGRTRSQPFPPAPRALNSAQRLRRPTRRGRSAVPAPRRRRCPRPPPRCRGRPAASRRRGRACASRRGTSAAGRLTRNRRFGSPRLLKNSSSQPSLSKSAAISVRTGRGEGERRRWPGP